MHYFHGNSFDLFGRFHRDVFRAYALLRPSIQRFPKLLCGINTSS
uniref:Uncharacterized protein n=1 Tax=Arundo donax TaxID=35708 RepID=A0A0A9FAP6_ARUDO